LKPLQHISIKSRLRLVLALIALFSIIFCAFSIYQINQVGSLVKELHDKPIKASDATMKAYVAFIKNRVIVRGIILKGKTIINDTDEFQIQENQKTLIDNLNIIQEIIKDVEGKSLESQARTLVIEWLDIRQQEFSLLREGRADDAMNVYNTRGTEQLIKIEDIMGKLNQYAIDQADSFLNEANEYRRKGVLFLITAALSGFGAALILILLIIRSILSSINALKNAMKRGMSEGRFIRAEIHGSNEVSQMAESFNGLVDVLESRMWIEQGKNGFNSAVAGNMPVDELAEKALSYITRYVEGASAVFYLFDENTESLKLISSFAFVERNHISNEYRLGEGIVGQAAKEKKPILLKKATESDGVITSGIINTLPASIYAFPLVFAGRLYGAVEIFMLTAMEKSKLVFLDEIGKILVSTLQNDIQSEKIRYLLDESEKAKLELIKQAEELQETNVQLEEQQQILNQQAEELQQANMQMEEQQQELQQMNLQLEDQKGVLDRQNRALIDRNRQMDLVNHELDTRTEELERAGRYKSELLANMSHELRTPLNSIILLSRLLSDNSGSSLNEKDVEKAAVIHNAGVELLTLIDDILDLSKIEAGKMQVNVVKFETNGLAVELMDMFKNLAEDKGLKYSVTDNIEEFIYNDKLKVTQIVRNFLSNAFKFTKEGSIELILDRNGTERLPLRIAVKDTGIGITHGRQKKIFDAFYQANSSITREHGGVGLGLSISKELAHLIGGEIHISSEYGKGSEFSLLLPDSGDRVGTDCIHGEVVYNTNSGSNEVQTVYHHEIQPEDASVLVITNNHKLVEKVSENVLGKGLRVLTAEDGKSGIDKAENYMPSGIILELNLPDMSGSRLLASLKSAEATRGIPVYIVSEEGQADDAANMSKDDNSVKPEVLEKIKVAVNSIIERDNKVIKHILILEDNKAQRLEMDELFEGSGVIIEYASDETSARDKLSRENYDAVIVDLMLENGNGVNICRYIQENGSKIPVIVYTAKNLDAEQELEIRKYADSIILKTPNSYERLKEEMSAFLNKLGESGKETRIKGDKLMVHHYEGLKGRRILVADDDAKNIFVMAAALENIGMEVGTAHNGKEAILRLTTERFDIVLMDIMMPVMDGYEAIRIIKNDETMRKIPIIAITAKALKGDKEKALEAGADDYISKPVDYDVLITILNAWIDNVDAEK
jgi:CheY-like chemotaxis protein/signal transduction histidine kinase